jgi:hypothetical protein
MMCSRTQAIFLFLFTIFLIVIGCMARAATAEDRTSYIDQHNRFILNGEPFFPLGLYVAQSFNSTSELDEIADSPFDTLMNYDIKNFTPSQIAFYLTQLELESRNLKLIFSLSEYFGDCEDTVTLSDTVIDAITDKVERFKHYGAVISWYMNDERGLSCLSELEAGYKLVRDLDDNHPVWSVHWNTDWLIKEAGTTDVVGVDSYPIDNLPITAVSDVADKAMASGKPLWLVPQVFDWRDGRGDVAGRDLTGRPPTREDMRAMTYLAVNHGAKGLIYYAYFNLVANADYDIRWPQIKEIAGQIQALKTVFLSIYETDDNEVTCDSDDIDLKLMWDKNKYYLFAVNTKPPRKIIMDNPDATYVGHWPSAPDPEGEEAYIDGGDFQQNTVPYDGDTATWTPDISEAGHYRVYAWWTAYSDRATDAPYTIYYDGGSEKIRVNQQENGSRWILLGTYPFAGGTTGSVVLSDDADGVVIADAIMWLMKHGDVTSASFEINLVHKPEVVNTLFEDGRQMPVISGKFTDSFDPYEVHVYRWEGEFEDDTPPSGGGSGGDGGCFIDTAAFRSPMETDGTILLLRCQ